MQLDAAEASAAKPGRRSFLIKGKVEVYCNSEIIGPSPYKTLPALPTNKIQAFLGIGDSLYSTR